MEEWRDIPGWEGYYQASTLGNIRRTKNKRLLKPGSDGRYSVAFLCRNSKREHYKWHRIIAKTFPELIEGEWFEDAEIDHCNGVKTDNRPNNLRWVSHSDNMNNPITKTKATSKKQMVIMFDDEQDLCYFFSIKGASKEMQTSRSNIQSCCKGTRKTTSGYRWRYA